MLNLNFIRKKAYLHNNSQSDVVNEVARRITPFLITEGYKKRGRNWSKQEEGYSTVINLQANKWYRRGDEVRFAINYGIFVPSTYEATFLMPIPKHPTEGSTIISKRLTNTEYADHWWAIRSQRDMERTSKQVCEWLEQVVLSYFAQIHSLADIANILSEMPNPLHLRSAAIIWADLGDKKRARELFQQTFDKAAKSKPEFAENVKAQALRYRINLRP